MQKYRATYEFEAEDDEQARRLAHGMSGLGFKLVELQKPDTYWAHVKLEPDKEAS